MDKGSTHLYIESDLKHPLIFLWATGGGNGASVSDTESHSGFSNTEHNYST